MTIMHVFYQALGIDFLLVKSFFILFIDEPKSALSPTFFYLFCCPILTECVRSYITSKRIEQESPITSQIKENFKAVQLGLTTIYNVFFYFVKVIWDSIAKVTKGVLARQ